MEQHFIVTFSLSGDKIGTTYTSGIVVEGDYPGHPTVMLHKILDEVEKTCKRDFGRIVNIDDISLSMIAKVN